MKRSVLRLAAAVMVAGAGAWIYGQYFSVPAQINSAGSAFMRATVSGDEAAIGRLLAPDSPLTATDIALLYRRNTFHNFNVYPIKALPNGSGVTWLANTSTIDLAGPPYTRPTTLAFKRVDGRWLVYKAGVRFSL